MTVSHRDGSQSLLTPVSVGPYLATRGMGDGQSVSARALTGGVSSVVLRVGLADGDVVVKQALARLAVQDDWFADPARSATEATALRYLRANGMTNVPEVIDADPERNVITISAAPSNWETLKVALMSGQVPMPILRELGGFLAACHVRSTSDVRAGSLPAELDDPEAFDALRVDPYFGTTAARLPDLAPEINAVAAELAGRRRCLVLGDFSPKNILISPGMTDTLVIDLEVANLGDPTFDVAFFCTHLLMKWVHLPVSRTALVTGIEAFLDGYADGPGAEDPGHLARLIACLLLARVWGSSPAEYLDPDDKAIVHRGALRLMAAPATRPLAWTELFT